MTDARILWHQFTTPVWALVINARPDGKNVQLTAAIIHPELLSRQGWTGCFAAIPRVPYDKRPRLERSRTAEWCSGTTVMGTSGR